MTARLAVIISTSVDKEQLFSTWKADFIRSATGQPGFVSVESLPKYPHQQPNTALVFTFGSEVELRNWYNQQKDRPRFAGLQIQNVPATSLGKDYPVHGSVTDVITNVIRPDHEREYLDWIRRIQMIQSEFPGHCGLYFQSPVYHRHTAEWLILLRFETLKDLEAWHASSVRQHLLSEAQDFVVVIQRQRVQGAFADWFPTTSLPPPRRKQTLLVLLVIFPVVALQQRFLSPLLRSWGVNPSLSIFICNALSVHLVAWPMMPLAQFIMQW